MSSEATGQALLAAVEASPAAVAVHDRAAWLALFADAAVVNDPVGSRAHGTAQARARFYDTFIAPNDIRFAVDADTVSGMWVVRDLTIMTAMPSGLKLGVPTHIRYELEEVGGALRIHALYAHWELLPMIGQVCGGGWPGMKTIFDLSVNMLRHQGLGGALGFMRAFGGVGRAGKRSAQVFLEAMQAKSTAVAQSQCAPEVSLGLPEGGQGDIQQLLPSVTGMAWHKMIAAGRMVTVSVTLGDRRGLLLLEFAQAGAKITALRWYLQAL